MKNPLREYLAYKASLKSKKEKSRLERVLRNVFLFVSVIGFATQAGQISVKYFRRGVLSKLVINVTDTVYPPAMSVCSRLGNIDYDNGHFTGQQLLDATPKAADIFNGCRMRLPGSYLVLDLNSSAECLKHMTVLRYTRHRQICYRFSLHQPYLIQHHRHTAESLVSKGLLYEILLVDKVFTEAILFDIEFTNTYPDRDLFPPLTLAVGDQLYTGGATGQNKTSFLTSYSLYTNHMLMAPYESNCIIYFERHDHTTSKVSCIEKCKLLTTRDRLQRVPFTAYISENISDWLSTDILSPIDLRNDTLTRILDKIEMDCMKDVRCQHNNCYDEVIVVKPLITLEDDALKLQVYAPREPYYETYMFPKMEFLDYAIYLASSVGFWFGVAVLDISTAIVFFRNRLVDGK
ncbi:hypothetical protein HDE_03882 [Halotydeus destructor]|nr:hypothetical protein HDE_03882 [Halotydeus destructor]